MALTSKAQQPAYTYYTVKDGLASNDTYNCVEDKMGFLWISTENGISRFDGALFKNYTIANGLPKNDIINIKMDSAGVIWALPYQQLPAYYDYNMDRFIQIKNSNNFFINKADILYTNILTDGSIAFTGRKGTAILVKNKKINFLNLNTIQTITQIISLPNKEYLAVLPNSYINLQTKKTEVFSYSLSAKRSIYINNSLYLADSNMLKKIKLNNDGTVERVIKNELPFTIVNLSFTGKQIAIISASGNIYFADTTSLQFTQMNLSFKALVRHVYEDKAGNTWICTRESGLVKYQQKGILSLNENEFNKNFNTLCFWNNKLVMGTNQGQLVIYTDPYHFKTVSINNEVNYNIWIKQLLTYKNDLYIISAAATYKYDNENIEKINNPRLWSMVNKACLFLSDSIILNGYSNRAIKVNYLTHKEIASTNTAVNCFAATNTSTAYIGSGNGLFKWKNYSEALPIGMPYLTNKNVSSLMYNSIDDILWVGLAYDTIFALQNDVIIAKIPMNNMLPGNECRKIWSNEKGTAWVGTNSVLAKINYTYSNHTFTYQLTNFSTSEGIAGKQINDITVHNDTVYVATNAGISFFPKALQIVVPNKAIYISSVKINNTDTILQAKYSLPANANNITIAYTSPDLGSSAERLFEYRINKGNWLKTKENKIDLIQLSPNTYSISIRPINRDGSASTNMVNIDFTINTPFWKSSIFITLLILGTFGAVFYYLQKRNQLKRERSIQQLLTEKKIIDLELKALKAQINPHFVFNCLNSIKYLNHQKRFDETDLYLDKFSYLLRKTLDFSGLQKITLQQELLYASNYLALEKLRLGPTFTYQINTDTQINTSTTLLPPMLLQPYLENAIKHGIRYLPTGQQGIITIALQKDNNQIICSIKDNGVGIIIAKQKNIVELPNHVSQGNALQLRRAELYNIQVKILTPINEQGTIIQLSIPYQNIT